MAITVTNDTIAAIATPPGLGGIGIIRISGPAALPIFRKLFRPHRSHLSFQSHMLYYGLATTRGGEVLDEVLAVYMLGPHTYTREDVVEFHSHGSYLVLQALLREILACGARAAQRGEFTKRAFLAGRIDLTRAEAVIELLQARTEEGRQLAVGQLQGGLQQRIDALREALLHILAVVEVAIDFPDDDVEILDNQQILEHLRDKVRQPLEQLIALAGRGSLIREGVKAVIVGRPNVGKSSLLNALLREDRALVTELPGTTRDTIEEVIAIQAIPVRLIDTAGIRHDADVVEELGIERARRKVAEADLILLLFDGSEPLTASDHELFRTIAHKKHLLILNKRDKATPSCLAELAATFPGEEVVKISAKELQGLDELEAAIYRQVIGETHSLADQLVCAPNIRHRACLEKALASCERLTQALQQGVPIDLIAVEVQTALNDLGDIVGLTTPDDVLDRVFGEFCLGK